MVVYFGGFRLNQDFLPLSISLFYILLKCYSWFSDILGHSTIQYNFQPVNTVQITK